MASFTTASVGIASLQTGSAGNVLIFIGNETTWSNGVTVFTATSGTITAQSINNTTQVATITYTASSTAGLITFSDGAITGYAYAGSASFVQDAFTDTGGTTLQAHTGSLGATWTKTTYLSKVDLLATVSPTGYFRPNAVTGSNGYYASGTPASADYAAGMLVTTGSVITGATSGLALRMSTVANTYYQCQLQGPNSNTVIINKHVAGASTTLLSTAFTTSPLTQYFVQFFIWGTSLAVFVNGSQLGSTVNDSSIATAGAAGLIFASNANCSDTAGQRLSNYIAGAGTPVLPLVSGTSSVTGTGVTFVSLTVGRATGGVAPYSYQWYRSTTSGFTPGLSNIVAGATSQTLIDTGLTTGTTYYYVNVATDNVGTTALSGEVVATPNSTLPISGVVTVGSIGNGTVSLSATVATGGTGSYTYQWLRSTDPASVTTPVSGAVSTTLLDVGLTNGTPYYYQIQTDDGANIALSNIVAAVPSKPIYVGIISDSWGNTVCSSSSSTAVSPSTAAIGNILGSELVPLFLDGTSVVVNNQAVGGTNGHDWAPGGSYLHVAEDAFLTAHSPASDWTVVVHLGINDSSVNYSYPSGGESVAVYQGYIQDIVDDLISWGVGRIVLIGPPYIGDISANHTSVGVNLLSQYFGALKSIASGIPSKVTATRSEYDFFINNQSSLGGDHVHPTPADSNGSGGAQRAAVIWANAVYLALNPTISDKTIYQTLFVRR